MFKKKGEQPGEAPKDLGFGNNVSSNHARLINPDGTYNIRREGLGFWSRYSFYHQLISIPWWKFNLIVIGIYLIINLFFALLYLAIGVDQLGGLVDKTIIHPFWEAYFFSAQTLTTVGYGRINPVGYQASVIAGIESLIGLLGFALATGLLYGRFARPKASILWSNESIVAPYRDINGWMFRIANSKPHQLIEIEVQVVLTLIEMENGKEVRKYHALELERNKVNFFPSSWTIVHPISDNSPMFGLSKDRFLAKSPEFLIILKAFDDTFSATVYSRYSYQVDQIAWGQKFVNIHDFARTDKPVVFLNKLSEYQSANLNESSESSEIGSESGERAEQG